MPLMFNIFLFTARSFQLNVLTVTFSSPPEVTESAFTFMIWNLAAFTEIPGIGYKNHT